MLRPVYTIAAAALVLTFAGCGKPKPAGPDETVKTFAKGMSEKKPEVAWELLPASYQKDVNGVVAAAAAKLDPDVHAKTVDTLNRLVNVLKTKKEYILGTPMLQQVPNMDKAKLTENYDSVVGILDTVVKSDLSNLSALKNPDVGKMIKETGGKLMQQVASVAAAAGEDEVNQKLNAMSNVQAKVLSQTETTAEMEVTFDGKTEKAQMVKVEDKWIPAEMANDWAGDMEKARKSIAETDVSKNKLQVLGVLGAASTILEQLEKAKSQEEFDQLLASGMQQVM